MVRASQFCVAPAGQSKLRSGGLREGSLTLACLRMCPLLQGSRDKAVDEALCGVSCLSGFCPGGARELQTNFDELEGLLMQAASAQTADPVEDAKQAVPPRVLLLACLSCCGLRLSGLLEVRNCRLWPLPGTSSCRRRFRRKRRSRRCSGSNTAVV